MSTAYCVGAKVQHSLLGTGHITDVFQHKATEKYVCAITFASGIRAQIPQNAPQLLLLCPNKVTTVAPYKWPPRKSPWAQPVLAENPYRGSCGAINKWRLRAAEERLRRRS